MRAAIHSHQPSLDSDSDIVPDCESVHASAIPSDTQHKLLSTIKNKPQDSPPNSSLKPPHTQSQTRSHLTVSASPKRDSCFQSSDRELLDKLKNITGDTTADNSDPCGCCMTEIAGMLEGKLQTLFADRLAKRQEKRAWEERLARLNEDLAKAKAKLYCAEKQANYLKAKNKRETDEMLKLEGKIGETQEEIQSIKTNGTLKEQETRQTLEDGLREYKRNARMLRAKVDLEKAEVLVTIEQESALEEEFARKDAEYLELKSRVDDFRMREAGRMQLFQTVSSSVGGTFKRRKRSAFA